MRFAVALLIGLVSANKDDTTAVWGLTSTNSEKANAGTQVSYGGYSTDAANARPPYRSNYLQQSDSDSSDSDSDDEDVQAGTDVRFDTFPVGLDKSTVYERVITPRFSQDTDDIFMRSMIATYAHEEKSEVKEHDDGTKTGGEPTGRFWMSKDDATSAAREVLSTHKGLNGAALDQYLATFLDKSWGHFDVNQTGWIEVIKMPQFCRFLASDQYMSLKESG